MCLGIPGEIIEIRGDDLGVRMGTVRFGGAEREVCLAYVPEAGVGDYVIVHVGVAISQVSEAEANEVFGYLQEIQALTDVEDAAQRGAGESGDDGSGAGSLSRADAAVPSPLPRRDGPPAPSGA